ncbi:MAG: response regulator [Desulfobulbus sp.]|jgi:PAS domain S-box-containing protein|uniref:response regulator n=1 Tax=Desulfobulbus sp. TaxID=895 RepID=UPI00284E6112|nr:response regulator [Desulfobulbus sp.]MDR2549073.1 response regulator [Desulfobulbus sp.]
MFAIDDCQVKSSESMCVPLSIDLVSVLDDIGIPIFISDFDTCRILYINKSASKYMYNVKEKKCFHLFDGSVDVCKWCLSAEKLKYSGGYNLIKNIYSQKNDKYFDIYECAVSMSGNSIARLCVIVDKMEEFEVNRMNMIKDSQVKLHSSIIMSSKTMFHAILLNSDMVFVNKSMEESVERSSSEILKLGLDCIYPPEVLSIVKNECIPALISGEEWKGETSVITKDGKIIPTRQRSFPVRDDNGNIIALATSMEDISEEKRMETMHQWQLAIMASSSDYISVADMNQRVIYNSPGAYKMMGYEQPDDDDMLPIENVHSEEYSRLVKEVGIPTAIRTGSWTSSDGDLRHRDGRVIPIEQTIFPVYGKKKELIGVATIIRDITEKIDSERDLAKAQRMLRAVIDSAPVGIFWKDRQLRYLGANVQCARDAGLDSPDELIGKSDYELYPQETADMCVGNDEKVFESGQSLSSEECVVLPKGEPRWLSVNKTLVTGGDESPAILLGVYDDITESKENQERLELAIKQVEEGSRAKSEFLSRMSHEIRTPMNAIIGMTKIAQAAQDTEKMRYCLDKIDGASNHLLGLINDILDMAKIEANKLETVEEPFDLENMLKNICSVIAVKAAEKKLDLSVSMDADVPNEVVGDELRLSQVLTNLLSNAIKFTPDSGRIQFNVKRNPECGASAILFEVIDTGIGISQEQIGKLFTSFEQAESSITRRFGGTGLGLAISKRIVELMDGEIGVTSESGKGSCFYFTVKLEGNAPEYRKKCNTSLYRDINVLVVDDDRDTLHRINRIMLKFGVHCDVATNGRDAVCMARKSVECGSPYDIIFADYTMDEMNGIETITEMNKINKNSFNVIMVPISDGDDILKEASDAGIDKFIQKPLFQSSIFNYLNEFIAIRDASGEFSAKDCQGGERCLEGNCLLLVEDIELNREIAIELLSGTGIAIDCATNGQEAVRMFQENPDKYDLVLMDLQMPLMGGLEATQRIRALGSAWATEVPIVAMTADAFQEDVETCKAAGMVDHIGKPINVDELIDKVTKYASCRKNGGMARHFRHIGR